MKQFELIVRGLIMKDGKILVCQTEGRDYVFLPGGHVEFGETMQSAFMREFTEELGIRPQSVSFIGSTENIFIQEGEQKHEVNFVFRGEIVGPIEPREDHITFFWFTPDQLIQEKFVPPVLRDAVLKYLADGKLFHVFAEEESE